MGIAYKNKLDISNTLKSMKKVVALGDPEDICVKQAKDLIGGVERSIRKTDGVDLDSFFKSQDKFDHATNLMEKREWEKAIIFFKEPIKLNKTHCQPYGNMGICYAKLGKKQQAIAAFDKALAIDPNYELANVNKKITESLKDSEILEADLKITEYYKEYAMKNKSYIQSLTKS